MYSCVPGLVCQRKGNEVGVTSHLQILAIVAMSYDELQKKAEEEEEAALAEEEALRVSALWG